MRLRIIFLVVALVCFILAFFGVVVPWGDLTVAGLGFWVAASIAGDMYPIPHSH